MIQTCFLSLTQGLNFLKLELKLLLMCSISYSKICEPSFCSFPHFYSILAIDKGFLNILNKEKTLQKNHFDMWLCLWLIENCFRVLESYSA